MTTSPTYQPGQGNYVLWMYLNGQHYTDTTFNTATMMDTSSLACVQAAKARLVSLPNSICGVGDHVYKDGWGNAMRFQVSGGRPVLISAGADSMFTINPNKTGTAFGTVYADATADNLRSDQR